MAPSRLRRVLALATVVAIAALTSAVPASAGFGVAPIDPAVLEAEGRTSALVHVRPSHPLITGLDAATASGLETGTTYDAINVFVAYGDASEFDTLATSPTIQYVEANAPIELITDNSHRATRGQNVLDGEVTLPDGTVIDGSGIGVAVVDSGVDGTHPDLESQMGGNVKIICTAPMAAASQFTPFEECRGPKTAVPLEDTDGPSAGGHGTHVAGIVAGDGTASDGRYHGAAPGATLYGVSVGTFLTVENALDGLAWVLANHDQVSPAIRVVNNSWGSVYQAYDPANGVFHKATWKLQEALVADGVSVVFAAGNSFGTGFSPTTTAECINPTPGIVCVANYRDENDGRRDGSIDGSSSRGEWDRPETWPDVAAPGTDIISTCRPTLPVCSLLGFPVDDNYFSLTGTSMAAPNVAGIVAQVLQANPSLTPAEIENLLEDTAHKFTWGTEYGLFVDAGNPDNSSSFEKGHGLVDVLAAVRVALGMDAAPGPSTFPPPPELPLHEEAGIILGAPTFIGFSVTEQEFRTTCMSEPASQAIDGYVFEIPEELRDDPLFARVGGSDPIGFHILQLSFYDANCDAIVSHGPTEAPVPAGTKFAVVTAPFAFAAQFGLELFEAGPTDAALTVTTEGSGSKKQVVAQLTEVGSGAGIPDRLIDFYADGTHIGAATTDAQGRATLVAPASSRDPKTIFTACFAGDADYSSAGTCRA